MVSVGGLASGLDTNSIISQLVELERRPIQALQRDIAELQQVQATFTSIGPSLAELNAAATQLSEDNLIQPSAEILGSSEAFAVTASSTTIPGRHDLSIAQLATAARLGSQGFADSDSTPIAAGSGTFAVRLGSSGAQISVAVTASTTMGDLVSAINAADGDITASVVQDGTNALSSRMVLTSRTTGSRNDIQVVTNDTDLDFTNPVIEAASADPDNAGTYTGTATSAGTYTGTANKTFLVEIVGTGAAGAATYRYSEDGGITWANSGATYTTSTTPATIGTNTEGVQIGFSAGGTLTEGDRFYVDVSTPVLSEARDAVFTLDGITQTRASNAVSDALTGVTLDLTETTSGTVGFSITQDDERVVSAVEDFVDAYNSVFSTIRGEQTFDTETFEAGILLGDRTANTILSQLRSTLTRAVTGATGSFDTLASLGITSSRTGGLEFDVTDFRDALASDRSGVISVLASSEFTDNSQLSVLTRQADPDQFGTYPVNVTTAPELASVAAGGAQTDTLGATEVLSFTYSSNYGEDSPDISAFSVSLSAGDTLSDVVNQLNSAFATQGVRLRALSSGGTLNIRTTEYGEDMFFTVVSDTASGANTTRIGTTVLDDTGVDIAGTIAGVAGTGNANVLTAATDSDLAGLAMTYTGSATGVVGDVTLTTGVGTAFSEAVSGLNEGGDSIIGVRNRSIQNQIDQIEERIADREEQVARTRTRLEEQFAALEVQLAGLQSQADFLTNQLGQLASPGQGAGS